MIDKQKLNILIENKEYQKITELLLDEYKLLFSKLTNTQHLNLSFMNLLALMKRKYPETSQRLNSLDYLLSDENKSESDRVYNLLNLYINFTKFYCTNQPNDIF